MVTTLLLFQAFFTAAGNCADLVLTGAWLVFHPAERRRLFLPDSPRAPSLDAYQEHLLRSHLYLAALDELFLWLNTPHVSRQEVLTLPSLSPSDPLLDEAAQAQAHLLVCRPAAHSATHRHKPAQARLRQRYPALLRQKDRESCSSFAQKLLTLTLASVKGKGQMSIFAWFFKPRTRPEAGEFPRTHVREVYHIRAAQPDMCYPLSEGEILRLLHTARYGDPFTQNSIQARLNQAMLPDPEERDVDQERCALDEKYRAWARSGQRPTPAFAQELLALMLRRTSD